MKKIAIQGTLGSYHDIAAHKYFEGEEIELICCTTFEDVFKAIRKDSQVIGMLAIENTIAGSLLHNNELVHRLSANINCVFHIASSACPRKIGVTSQKSTPTPSRLCSAANSCNNIPISKW